ncbi:MAG: NAD-dependent epimerase/dehydratase family protein [Chitinispirillaceae bacterium]|nr:NAD-dependent epimerase/dehydratase family protein [Chitinispirillaceae bacterium]
MHILLIGGTGNISSEVALLLHQQGHTITTVTTGKRPVPKTYHAIHLDRNDSVAFKQQLGAVRPDVAIDFFAFVPEHLKTCHETFKGAITQFIFISSAAVYEKPHRRFPITENTPRSNPFWSYAQDKIACEKYLESVHSPEFPVTIVRPSHTFGNQWIPSPINSNDFTIARRILDGRPVILHDNGESLWTLTAASDFAAGLAGLAGNVKALGEAFHITSDEALTWNQIYRLIGDALGKEAIIEYIPSEILAREYPESYGMLFGDKKEHGVFDNQKIKRFVPGFECRKGIKLAIEESIGWFLTEPSRQAIDVQDDKLIDRLITTWRRSNTSISLK